MRWFSVFSDAWNSLTHSDGVDAFTPIVNIDGTPMLNESIDIQGNPFGVTSIDTPASQSFDWGSSDCAGSGSGGFSDWP